MTIGIEIVGSRLLDGNADRSRISLVSVSNQSKVAIISIEDMIADRMGQFSSTPQGVKEMLNQAVVLLNLAPHLDEQYLDERIRKETSDLFDLTFLKAQKPTP